MRFNFRVITILLKISTLLIIIGLISSFITPTKSISSSPLDSIGMGTSLHLSEGIDNLAASYDSLSNMNIHWVREEFPWSEIEQSPGEYNWSYTKGDKFVDFDSMLALASRSKIKVLAVLDGGPLYLTQVFPDQPVDADLLIQHWTMYVQAVVDRYGSQIDYWEIGNEMNSPVEWGKVMFPTISDAAVTPSPFLFARMLTIASKIIKKDNPRDTIILGGLYNSSTADCSTSPLAFLAEIANAGAWDTFDVIGLHPYWQNNPPEVWMQRGPSFDAESGRCQMDQQIETNLLGEIRQVYEFTKQWEQKPIWITEIAWQEDWLEAIADQKNMSPNEVQASYVVRSLVPLLSELNVQKIFWNTSTNDSSIQNYELHPEGQIALRNIARLLGGARPLGQFQQFSDLGSPQELGIFDYRFRKEGRTIVIAWAANGGTQPYQITLTNLPGKKYRAYAVDAVDLSLKGGMALILQKDNSLTMYVNENPAILIEETSSIFSSLKYRIEDSTARKASSIQSDVYSWVRQQKKSLSEKALQWAEDNVFTFLNWGVDKLSGN